jgi:hypothetical protein
MQGVLSAKYENGELQRDYVFHEYPKLLRVSRGVQHFDHATEVIRGNATIVRDWSEDREVFEEIIVNSEAEEEAVLAGGQTEGQIEEHRQSLIVQAKQRGVQVDPTWGVVRLQRELGAAPSSETIDVMRAKIADLEEKAALRARIAELEAAMAGRAPVLPTVSADDPEELRAQLVSLGVEVDRRWGLARLRQELDAATAPGR